MLAADAAATANERLVSLLASPIFTQPVHFVVHNTNAFESLIWTLKKVQAVNRLAAELFGPDEVYRMHVVPGRVLMSLGRFPRWPDDRFHIRDLENFLQVWLDLCDDFGRVNNRYLDINMYSHRWLRPHYCPQCEQGDCPESVMAHPDDENHSKAKSLGAFVRFQEQERPEYRQYDSHYGGEGLYWIDFAAINQDNNAVAKVEKANGMKLLPIHVACCDRVIVHEITVPGYENMPYEPRPWTRVERLLAYSVCSSNRIHVIVSNPAINRSSTQKDLAAVLQRSVFYTPMILERNVWQMRVPDPLLSTEEVKVTNPSDLATIRSLKEACPMDHPVQNLFSNLRKEPLEFSNAAGTKGTKFLVALYVENYNEEFRSGSCYPFQ